MNMIDVIRAYGGSTKDKEMLAFVGCAMMTGDADKDGAALSQFLHTVNRRTESVWSYIDWTMYHTDYEQDSVIVQILHVLHKIILTTQTIERTIFIARSYGEQPSEAILNLFQNCGMGDVFKERPEEKIQSFLKLMFLPEPYGLGLWKGHYFPTSRIN